MALGKNVHHHFQKQMSFIGDGSHLSRGGCLGINNTGLGGGGFGRGGIGGFVARIWIFQPRASKASMTKGTIGMPKGRVGKAR